MDLDNWGSATTTPPVIDAKMCALKETTPSTDASQSDLDGSGEINSTSTQASATLDDARK